jgi:serine/threonine-protein kinase HipA
MRGGAATTHILKPLIVGEGRIRDSVQNESFCLLLARRCGLAAASAEIRHTSKQPFLLVERYDRQWQGGHVVRLHQEDFCQALSVSPENKYEREGGPGITACLKVIQEHSVQPVPDRLAFLKAVVFNYVIGNADAHGKNFSFLHEKGKPRLAPAYDLLCTAVYPDLSVKMAMRIGGKYLPDRVFLRHWHRLVADTAGAKRAMEKTLAETARQTLEQAELLSAELAERGPKSEIYHAIVAVIRTRSESLLQQV